MREFGPERGRAQDGVAVPDQAEWSGKRPNGDVCRWQTPIADRAEGENLAASQRDNNAQNLTGNQRGTLPRRSRVKR